MKNYFILIFAFCFCTGTYAQSEKSQTAILEKIHWLIERSDMNKVRQGFREICDEIHFPSLVSGLKDGMYKGATPDDEYGKRMLESGTTPAIAYPKYENQMLQNQDFNQVDAVSGASYSNYRFKLAILYAIMNSGQL